MRKLTLRLLTKAVVDLGLVSPRFFAHNESLEVLHTFASADSVSQVVRIRRKGPLPSTAEIERRRGELLGRYALQGFEVLDRDDAREEVTALITRRIPHDLAALLREVGSEVVPGQPFIVGPRETILTIYAAEGRLPVVYGLLGNLGIRYEVASARVYRGERSSLGDLTERQRATLELAYRLGYYDTPSRTSLARLAKIAGVSRAAVSKTLRRAEARVLAATFGGQVSQAAKPRSPP